MVFREFSEFSNPEEADYDITSSLREDEEEEDTANIEKNNAYIMQLWDLIGILEDVEEEDLIRMYGITEYEYFHPTAETIKKVSQRINSEKEEEGVKHR